MSAPHELGKSPQAMDTPSPVRVVLKALALFGIVALGFAFLSPSRLGQLSLYNRVFPGRERLPFGEDPQHAYNLSLYNLDAMFASHELAASRMPEAEHKVFVLGDSSVWGTLLRPDETLAGQLNAQGLTLCGKPARFYNLGYPTLSLAKDLLILDEAMKYQPDRIVWLTTLESFLREDQLASPILANNPDRTRALIAGFHLNLDREDSTLTERTSLSRTLIGQRRNLADLIRLQLYGVMWAATDVDQAYPIDYPRAQTDLKPDVAFHGRKPPKLDPASLALDVLDAGFSSTNRVPVLLVNEPILISKGANSDIRYNFFYPRWAYDQYRRLLAESATDEGWDYLDLWNLIPPEHFTNTAIHLDAGAAQVLSAKIAAALASSPCK
jgi:hypothetical protein